MNEDCDSEVRRRAYVIWQAEGEPQGEELRHWFQASGEEKDRNTNTKESDSKSPEGGPDAAATDSDPNAAIKKERAKEREGEQPPEPKGAAPRQAAG